MIQVKSGRGRVSNADMSTLREWARAYRARAEVWYFKRSKGLTKQVVANSSREA